LSAGGRRDVASQLAGAILLSKDGRSIAVYELFAGNLEFQVVQYSEKDRGLTLSVRIVPRASRSEIVGEYNGALRIRISAAPVDGAANRELIRLLAKTFKLPQNSIAIVSGFASPQKIVHLSGVNSARFEELLWLK
jgi:uncharacterized protein